MGSRISIVVFDGFDEIDVFGPFEMLAGAGLSVGLTTAGRPGLVRSMRGVQVEVTAPLDAVDGVIVPGGGWLNRAPSGVWAEVQRGDALPFLGLRRADLRHAPGTAAREAASGKQEGQQEDEKGRGPHRVRVEENAEVAEERCRVAQPGLARSARGAAPPSSHAALSKPKAAAKPKLRRAGAGRPSTWPRPSLRNIASGCAAAPSTVSARPEAGAWPPRP
jgi:hypothetical protein